MREREGRREGVCVCTYLDFDSKPELDDGLFVDLTPDVEGGEDK